MEMIVLNYVNELCIYPRLLVLPKTQNQRDKLVCFTHANALLSYVNETVCSETSLQDSCQSFYGPGQLIWCQGYLKMHVVGEGPGAILFSFETFPFSN